MAATIAITLSLITIVLLLIFLIRFKKIFSTENIIEKTKSYMDRMIKDINGQANRDLDLINESSRRLRALLNETEHKMEQFREASRLLQNAIAEADKVSRLSGNSPLYVENKNVSEIKPVRKPSVSKKIVVEENNTPSLFDNQAISPDSSYEIVKPQQSSLFDAEEESSNNNPILDDVTNVMPDGSAYKHVPLIITKVLDEEPRGSNQGQTENKVRQFNGAAAGKKEFSEQVMDLFNKGFQIEQIANELSCSITEVQFVIDMGL